MKIWIHLDNTQLGPFDINELPLQHMTQETPVWYEGLSYWEPAGRAPLTANLFNAPAPDTNDEDSSVSEYVEAQVEEVGVDHVNEANADDSDEYSQGNPQYQQDQQWQPQDQQWQQPQGQQWQQPQDQQWQQQPKCPPSFLVWSILITVLCCNPIGIIPIITGANVSSRYNNYDYDGARRASEQTEWWLIITIVTSLMIIPLSVTSLIMML